MDIKISKIHTTPQKGYCFVHARGDIDKNGKIIVTTQPLRLSGSDIFYRMNKIISKDSGETWSEITSCEFLDRRKCEDGTELCMSDATPLYHKKTGTFLLTGHSVVYKDDEIAPDPRKRHILYSVFNEKKQDFENFSEVKIPDVENEFFNVGSGCCQCCELPDGDILIPFYGNDLEGAKDPWHSCSKVSVIRCGFDGKKLECKEIGNVISVPVPRGLGEPSIVKAERGYFLCLRNDESGYVAKSDDGLHFEAPKELCFDDGANAGNYCTQQHWIRGKDKLYLVYTRRAENNGHIFRHSAPLFMAEFDTEKMCLIRDTEVIVVPERGARLGNFGCFNASDNEAYVIAAEWMQSDLGEWETCAKYGSDNSIFVTKINF